MFTWLANNTVRQEREKARQLRKGQWWKNQIGTGICHYCKQRFEPKKLCMDHKIPISKGGQSKKTNLVPSCKNCNTRKKDQLLFKKF